MDYEATIHSIGGFGFYQKSRLCLLGVLLVGSGIQTLLNVIILYVPHFKCSTNQTFGNITYNVSTDQCYLYSNNESEANISHGAEERFSCDSWHYDDTDVVATAATDMNFVCENSGIIPLTTMVYMSGIFAASLTGGLLSDWKGRKLTQGIILVIQVLCTVPLYFITTSDLLIFLRFFGGASSNGTFVTVFVLAMEIIPSTYGTVVGVCTHIMFSIGQIVVITMAYFTREWHLLSLVVAATCFLYLFFLFFMDESPRWLISKGKQEKAEDILRKIAKKNGTEYYSVLTETKCAEPTTVVKGSFKDLFKSRILLSRAFNMFFNWTAVNTVYYGLVFGSSNLVGDLYISTLLLAVVELISYVILIFLMKKWGRKPLYSSSIILAGVSCFVSGFVKVWAKDIRWLSILLLLIGKFAASASFAVIYNYTTELFPTVIRNSVLGLSSCFGRFGSMAAPYILAAGTEMTSKIGAGLPVILFGVLAIAAGLLSLFLPETKGYSLPDTFEEGENIGRKINEELSGKDNAGMDLGL
ncbi:organic cation transporter protein-like, partial [Argonauta hians]